MKYILSQQITFRADDGALWNLDNSEDVMVLQESVARVLHCLVVHAGQVITREEVFQEVWEKYNLQPSNNSLNQYIFAIRKALRGLGLAGDLIQTIPKTGFFVSAEDVVCLTQDLAEPGPARPMPLRRTGLALGLAAAVAIGGLVGGMIHLGMGPLNQVKQQLYPIGHLGECPVYTFSPDEPGVRQALLDFNREIASQPHFRAHCVPNAFYVVFAEDRFILNSKGRRMMSRCQYQPDSQIRLSQCKSVYIYEH